MIVTSPQRPTGTVLATKEPPPQPPTKQQVVMGAIRMLQAEYGKTKPRSAGEFQYVYTAIGDAFKEGGVTNQDIFDVWRRIPANDPKILEIKFLVGWLLAHSNMLGKVEDVSRFLSLDERINPWPSQAVSAAIPMQPKTQAPVVQPPAAPSEPSPLPFQPGGAKDPHGDLLPHPDAFKGYMGRLKGQHILVVEGIAPGSAAIMQILLGAAQENKDDLGRSTVKGVVIDLTGETYLGLEANENAVYYAGMPSGYVEPVDDEDDEPEPKFRMSKEEKYFLPQMEGIYQAALVLDGRIDIKERNARAGQPCEEFSPYYAIVRLWNVISKDWNALDPTARKSLQDTWRTHYGHGKEESLDIKKAIARIFDLGHTANMILVFSVSRLGKVEEMGLSTYDLNSMTILIVAEPRIDGGTKAVNAAMRDNRLEFVSAHRVGLKAQIDVATVRYSHQNQFILASVEPPEVFPLETSKLSATGERIPITCYKSKMLSGFAND